MRVKKPYRLVGCDGNAFSIIAYSVDCMRNENVGVEKIDKYMKDSMSGGYNNLINISSKIINELNENEDENEDEDEDEDYCEKIENLL